MITILGVLLCLFVALCVPAYILFSSQREIETELSKEVSAHERGRG